MVGWFTEEGMKEKERKIMGRLTKKRKKGKRKYKHRENTERRVPRR